MSRRAIDRRMNLALVKQLKGRVATELSARRTSAERAGRPLGQADRSALTWELIATELATEAKVRIGAGQQPWLPDEEDQLAQAVYDDIFGSMGSVLERYLADESITDIHANGCDVVWLKRADGTKEPGDPIASSDEELIELIRTAGARMGLGERRFDAGSPQLDLRLPDGSRLSAVMAVSARPIVSIRRHRYMKVSLEDLVGLGAIDTAIACFLGAAVLARKNIIVAGGTGVGKTTLLRALIDAIPPAERLITVENTLELGIDQFPEGHPDVVAFEAREANTEGTGAIAMAELVRRGLRHDPDRVIVGEVLGDEILVMLNAMAQGNNGSLSTIHANSSEGVFRRIVSYALQSPERLAPTATNYLIAGALDLVVFLDSYYQERRRGGARHRRRFVSSVREVLDADEHMVVSNEVFRPGPERRAVPGVPVRCLDDLVDEGFEAELLNRRDGWWAP